ncbi:MAG TPA: ABC transporter substrate-binding protein [Ramlibacter sp.]|nr:ABC transporter substrate-binding protein [Ramlibacter sp.]
MTLPASPSAISRRSVLMSLAAAPLALHSPVRAQDPQSIRICQSTALSGPLGDLGQALLQGAQACFGAVNAHGGVHGRKIDLVVLDDGYEVKRALANLDTFLADRATFALFNCFGTPIVTAMLPRVIEAGLPFFAPYTGALVARPRNTRNVFNIRASYPDEAEQLVQHLATIGIKRIGIAYQNNSFGKEVFDAARIAMEKHKLQGGDGAVATVENSGADAAAAATKIVQANPEAVLVGLAGKPTLDFVKAIRTQRRGMPLYALSVMGSAATLRALGDDGVGMAVSQVVPLPTSVVVPVVRQFQQAWKATGTSLDLSHLALEGYINARVFVEALSRAGRNLSRERFIDSMWNIKRHDLGGFEVNFSEPGRNASRFVELTMVGREGRFIR